jgi:hypothetical protein
MAQHFGASTFEVEGGVEHQPVPLLSSLVSWVRGPLPVPAAAGGGATSVAGSPPSHPNKSSAHLLSMGSHSLSRSTSSGSPPRTMHFAARQQVAEQQQQQQSQQYLQGQILGTSPQRSSSFSSSTATTPPTTPHMYALNSRSASPRQTPLWSAPQPHRPAPFKL